MQRKDILMGILITIILSLPFVIAKFYSKQYINLTFREEKLLKDDKERDKNKSKEKKEMNSGVQNQEKQSEKNELDSNESEKTKLQVDKTEHKKESIQENKNIKKNKIEFEETIFSGKGQSQEYGIGEGSGFPSVYIEWDDNPITLAKTNGYYIRIYENSGEAFDIDPSANEKVQLTGFYSKILIESTEAKIWGYKLGYDVDQIYLILPKSEIISKTKKYCDKMGLNIKNINFVSGKINLGSGITIIEVN